MSRWHRVAVAGTVYHVLNRAANRRQIFFGADDYRAFIRLLWNAVAVTGMRVIAYCVMPNHWHLIVWPSTDGVLPTFIHRLTWSHALQIRRQSNTIGEGHVYQARYRSFPVQTERYYYNALKYVEGNGMRAELVRRAEEWPWSSLPYRDGKGTPLAAGPVDLPAEWIEIVNQGPSAQDLEVIRACAHNGRPYGAEEWANQVALVHDLEHTFRTPGRPPRPSRQWFC